MDWFNDVASAAGLPVAIIVAVLVILAKAGRLSVSLSSPEGKDPVAEIRDEVERFRLEFTDRMARIETRVDGLEK